MRRSPGFFAIAAGSLAVALGLSTTVFAHIDSLAHPSVPVREVDNLYWTVAGPGGERLPRADEAKALLGHVPSIEAVTIESRGVGTISAGDQGGAAYSTYVDADYFGAIGLRPTIGRIFAPSETEGSGVVILSDPMWRALFGDRKEIGDATVLFDGRPFSVVGVLPAGLKKMMATDVWFPSSRELLRSRLVWIDIRLKRGRSPAIAAAQLSTLLDVRLGKTLNSDRASSPIRLLPYKPDPVRLSEFQGAMIAAATCILVIACANVAALMLARGVVKRRDQALRLSLGASNVDILASVAAEVCVIAVAGGLAGLLLTGGLMHALAGSVPERTGQFGLADLNWNWRVFLGPFVAMVMATGLAATLPAWYATRIAPNESLKESAGTTTGRPGSRFRVLVVAEIALSMVLLIGTSLVGKATRKVAAFDFGYDARSLFVVTANVSVLPDTGAVKVGHDSVVAARRPFVTVTQFNTAVDRVRTSRGVLAASAVWFGAADNSSVISDQMNGGATPLNIPRYLNVDASFFKTLGIPIEEGRDFVEGDRAGRGAAILDQRAARKLFPRGGAVGRMVKLGDARSPRPWIPVVGIARNAQLAFPADGAVEPDPVVYASLPIEVTNSGEVVVRPSGRGTALTAQQELMDQLPPRTFVTIHPWLERYEYTLGLRRFTAAVFIDLGVASLILAAAGLFSVLSYSVGQRKREFAVRTALGASRGNVMRLVMADGIVMALGGTAVGALVGTWAGFLLNTYLWGVYPADAGAMAVAELILFVVTITSCVFPALRATRADPVEILRAA